MFSTKESVGLTTPTPPRVRPWATYALGITGILFLVAYPFRAHAVGAFVMHVAAAACIGGLADWYGVVALFRKPLGIFTWRTAVIPRNRDRLVGMAQTMIREELFTRRHWYQGIKNMRPVEQALAHLHTKAGHQLVRDVWMDLLAPLWQARPWESVWQRMQSQGMTYMQSWPWAQYVAEGLDRLQDPALAAPLWQWVRARLRSIVGSPTVTHMGVHIMTQALDAYVAQGMLRSFLRETCLTEADLKDLVERSQAKAQRWLDQQDSLDSPGGQYFLRLLGKAAHTLRTDPVWQARVQQGIGRALQEAMAQPGGWGTTLAERLSVMPSSEAWERWCYTQIERLETDPAKLEATERQLLGLVASLAQRLTAMAERLAQEHLAPYSGEDLAAIVEEHTGQDLQMIRWNGSVVGGILGGLFYLIHWLGQSIVGGAL